MNKSLKPIKNIVKEGDKYGYFTVIKEAERRILPSGKVERMVLCKCKCGNSRIVFLNNLIKRKNASCGCWKKESKINNFYKHGLSKHPLHSVWNGMRSRVKDQPSWEFNKHYFGKGVVVCDEWAKDFKCFYDWAISNGYEKGLEIDRRDNDGNYEPSNCRFVTEKVNCNNRGNNVRFEYNGKLLTMAEIALLVGMCQNKLRRRLYYYNMNIYEAVSKIDYRKTANWRQVNKDVRTRGKKIK